MLDLGLTVVIFLIAIVALLIADPDRKQHAAAWLACGWVLPSAVLMGIVTARLGPGILFFPAPFGSHAYEMSRAFRGPHMLYLGAPFVVLFWRVVCWGWVPALLFPRLNLTAVYLIGLVADTFFLPIASFSPWIGFPFHAITAAICIIPAQLFSRWTVEQRELAKRVWLHFFFHSALLLGVLTVSIFSITGGVAAPFVRDSVANKILIQLILIPGLLLAAAMREFYFAGGTPMPADPPLKLVTTGPYAYVANPMQIGKFGVLVGWAVFWSSTGMYLVALLGLLYSLVIASPREEKEMSARFGNDWTTYRTQVRRWWPRWRPFIAANRSPAAPHAVATQNQARLYIDVHCGPCGQFARWLTQQNPTSLLVLPMAVHPNRTLQEIAYTPADGGPELHGILALARGAEHVNLFWAFFGWMIALPAISWFTRTIAAVAAARPAAATIAQCAPTPANALPATTSAAEFRPAANPPATQSGAFRLSPAPVTIPATPRNTDPMVYVVAGLSLLLFVMVLFIVFWEGSPSQKSYQLRHGNSDARLRAAYDLAREGPAAIALAPDLQLALDDPDPRVRSAATSALLRMGAWQQLNSTDWMNKVEPFTITAALTTLHNTYPPPPDAFPVVENLLRHHPNADVRQNALISLSHFGARAIPDLQDALMDPDPIVRSYAQTALHSLTGRPLTVDAAR